MRHLLSGLPVMFGNLQRLTILLLLATQNWGYEKPRSAGFTDSVYSVLMYRNLGSCTLCFDNSQGSSPACSVGEDWERI